MIEKHDMLHHGCSNLKGHCYFDNDQDMGYELCFETILFDMETPAPDTEPHQWALLRAPGAGAGRQAQ